MTMKELEVLLNNRWILKSKDRTVLQIKRCSW